jgi:hypothetical protein
LNPGRHTDYSDCELDGLPIVLQSNDDFIHVMSRNTTSLFLINTECPGYFASPYITLRKSLGFIDLINSKTYYTFRFDALQKNHDTIKDL